jgi:predicted O-linked N-acetylglucosamine transferase (SPINDLY family)
MKGGVGTAAAAPALGRGFVTFGSMNNFIKVSPEAIALWCDILSAVPRSRLIMTNVPEGSARAALYSRFAAAGVAKERLEFHIRVPNEHFRALMQQIDIALDSFPYNGTTTICEALSMGIPVVTLVGTQSVSRSGYALLKTAGVPDLCAPDAAGYRRVAVDLATDPERLSAMRDAVLQCFHASPLRDAASLARDLETAYREMWRQWCGTRTS